MSGTEKNIDDKTGSDGSGAGSAGQTGALKGLDKSSEGSGKQGDGINTGSTKNDRMSMFMFMLLLLLPLPLHPLFPSSLSSFLLVMLHFTK